jgi:hypothetical protein
MKTIGVVVVLALTMVITTAARGDVVVFKDGTYQEGKVKSITDASVTMESQYGDLPYARNIVQSVHPSTAEQPGQEYYQAGLVLLQMHKKQTAKKLFDQAVAKDERYSGLVSKALNSYTPKPSYDVEARMRPPSSTDVHSHAPTYRIQCKLCNGTGRVEYKIKSVAWVAPDDSPLMGFA